MAARIVLMLSLVLALYMTPATASAARCSMDMPVGQAIDCGCCGIIQCCALSRDTAPQQPATALVVSHEQLAAIAPVFAVVLSKLPVMHPPAPRVASHSKAVGPPRLALFCTFLI